MTQLTSLADAPNTLREYETIYILRPNTKNDQVGEVNGKVRELIESRGGKVVNVDNWGKRRLAYEVQKEVRGIYLYWQYLGSPAIVSEFERNMRLLDPVIRYMTVKVDADIDPSARPSEVDAETFEKAAVTAADEEELMLRRSDNAEEGEEANAEAEGAEAEAKAEGAEGEEAKAEGSDKEAKAEGESKAEEAEKPKEETADDSGDKE